VGTPAGGARSAADAAGAAAAVFGPEAVAAAVSEERGGAGVCVRLSLEEAVFLVHVLGTLKIVIEQEAQKTVERRSEGKRKGESEHAKEKAKEEEEEEEEPPSRVAREMGGEELWRFACLQASSKGSRDSSSCSSRSSGSSRSGGCGGEEEEDSDGDGDGGDGGGAFLRSYAAFHHFRCKGWTVRSGLRYGCDFVLYRGHPASSHADVCVLAVRRGAAGGGAGGGGAAGGGAGGRGGGGKEPRPPFFTARESPSRGAGPLSWLDVEIGNRLAAQVGKRLLLLHVHVSGRGGEGGEGDEGGGAGGGEEGGGGGGEGAPRRRSLLSLTAAEALSRVTVEERLVERWVPDVDREEPVV